MIQLYIEKRFYFLLFFFYNVLICIIFFNIYNNFDKLEQRQYLHYEILINKLNNKIDFI